MSGAQLVVEYRLEHPGSPSPRRHPPGDSPRRPALRPSLVGRRVHFAAEENCDSEEEEQAAEAAAPAPTAARPYLRQTSYCPSPPGPAYCEAGSPAHGYACSGPPFYGNPVFLSPHQQPPQQPVQQSPYGSLFYAAYAQQPSAGGPAGPYSWQPGGTLYGVADPQQQGQFQPYASGAPAAQPPLAAPQAAAQAAAIAGPAAPTAQPLPPAPQPSPPQRQNQQQQQPGPPEHQYGQQAAVSMPAPLGPAIKPAALDSAQLHVTANTVSITVAAAQLEQRGGGTPALAPAAAERHTTATAQREHPAKPATPSQSIAKETAVAAPAAAVPSAKAAAAIGPTASPAAPPKPPTASCQTQTDAAPEPEAHPAQPAASSQQPDASSQGPPPAPPRLALPLPPGIPAHPGGPPRQQRQQQPILGSNSGARQREAVVGGDPGSAPGPKPCDSTHQEPGGDLSYWGRTHMEDSYFEDGLATGGSLSSGLSPRESRPRRREWDHVEALQALASGAESYAKAARQHKAGRGGPVSTTDALPARLAAQQLGSLAGMSAKVQEAILHSQSVFEHQAEMVEQAVLQRAFYAWKNLRDGRAMCRRRQDQIRRRMQRSLLRRCLHEWGGFTGRQERQKRALQQARAILARRLLQRCFKEWALQCADRRWKTQLALKDEQLQRLANEIRHMESRPVRYMQRYRGRRWLHAWQEFAGCQCAKEQRRTAAAAHSTRQQALKALAGWQAVAEWQASRCQALQRAARLLQRLRLQHCFSAWRGLVGGRAYKQSQQAAASALHRELLQRRALGGWRYVAWFWQAARDAALGKQLQRQAAALQAWRQQLALAQARRALLAEADAARAVRLRARALYGWRGYVEGRQARALQEEHDRLAELSGRLQAENEYLKTDNERLGRVIDSGDWGRQRVAELTQADEVLRKERDGLLELVQSLQAQQQQAEEGGAGACSHLRITAAGISGDGLHAKQARALSPRALSPSNSPPPSPGLRNKLLVKSGSSFNAMVRALKQDLVTSGALSRNPAATYEVDQLSLSRVGVKPGGELEVEALASPNLSGVAFGRSRRPPSAPGKRLEGKQGGSGDLLQAALRLQSIGGRSVALGKRV